LLPNRPEMQVLKETWPMKSQSSPETKPDHPALSPAEDAANQAVVRQIGLRTTRAAVTAFREMLVLIRGRVTNRFKFEFFLHRA
jgi:hypothetical protein